MTVDRLGEAFPSPRNQALANILRATPLCRGVCRRWAAVVENKARVTSRFGASLREANMPEPVAIDPHHRFRGGAYKAGAGAEAGRFRSSSAAARGGGGAVAFGCLRALRAGRSCDPSRSGQTKQVASHTIHVLAPGTVECDIVDFLEEAPAPARGFLWTHWVSRGQRSAARSIG